MKDYQFLWWDKDAVNASLDRWVSLGWQVENWRFVGSHFYFLLSRPKEKKP